MILEQLHAAASVFQQTCNQVCYIQSSSIAVDVIDVKQTMVSRTNRS